MRIIPEIDLPEHLEYSYTPDFMEFIEQYLPGSKYINIRRMLGRNNYEKPCFKIELQDKPAPTQRPQVTAKEISEVVMKLLQYQADSSDTPGQYKVEIYRNGGKNNNEVKSKHLDITAPGSGAQNATVFSPNEIETDVMASQANYIAMLHEQNVNMLKIVTTIIEPLNRQNQELQKSLQESARHMVEMEKARLNFELIKKAEEEEFRLNELKERNKQRKWEELKKTLDSSGAIKAVTAAITKRISGPVDVMVQDQDPSQIQQKEQELRQERIKEEGKSKEDIKKEVDEELNLRPVSTYCKYLKNSIAHGEDKDFEDFMRTTLRKEMYDGLMDLINSETEEIAISNLINLKTIFKPEDINDLQALESRLTRPQKVAIGEILKYDPKNFVKQSSNISE